MENVLFRILLMIIFVTVAIVAFCSNPAWGGGTTECRINSVSLTPECPSPGCTAGDKLRIDVNYSGNCPSPVYIQIDASGGSCTICDDDRSLCPPNLCSINGIQIVCNSSPCRAYWTVPFVPSDCKGETVKAISGRLLNNYMCEGGTLYDLTNATGYFKFSTGYELSTKIVLSPGWNLISSPYHYTSVKTNCSYSMLWSWDAETYRWSTITKLEDMAPGKGYWIKVPNRCEVEFTGARKVTIDDLPRLYAGLNLISIPADRLDIVNSKGCNVIAVYNYSTLENTWYKYILSERKWYKYNPNTKSYEFFMNENNPVLAPGRGYWIKVLSDCKFSSTTTTTTSTTTTTLPPTTTTTVQSPCDVATIPSVGVTNIVHEVSKPEMVLTLTRVDNGLSYTANVKAMGCIYNFGVHAYKWSGEHTGTIFPYTGTHSGVLTLPDFNYAWVFAALQPYYFETFENVSNFPVTKTYKPSRVDGKDESFWYRYYLTVQVKITGNTYNLPVNIGVTYGSSESTLATISSDGTYTISGYFDHDQPTTIKAHWCGKTIQSINLPSPVSITGK